MYLPSLCRPLSKGRPDELKSAFLAALGVMILTSVPRVAPRVPSCPSLSGSSSCASWRLVPSLTCTGFQPGWGHLLRSDLQRHRRTPRGPKMILDSYGLRPWTCRSVPAELLDGDCENGKPGICVQASEYCHSGKGPSPKSAQDGLSVQKSSARKLRNCITGYSDNRILLRSKSCSLHSVACTRAFCAPPTRLRFQISMACLMQGRGLTAPHSCHKL